jgi:hypothetical protein
MIIIESEEILSSFLEEYKKQDVIIIPIYNNSDVHMIFNGINFLFIHLLFSSQDYILPINNHDCINLEFNLNTLKDNPNKKFVMNKKRFLYFGQFDEFIDLSLIEYFILGEYEDTNNDTLAHSFLKSFYNNNKNVNSIIPISKQIEGISSLLDNSIELTEQYKENEMILDNKISFDFFNKKVIRNLWEIENNGLKINPIEFIKHFTYNYFKNDYVYTEYNIYTSTGRPSNHFGGVNFSALNKRDESRKSFISRFKKGILVEFDWTAYHLNLIAMLINYDIPKISMHEYLGRKFFNTDNLTEEQYDQSKKKTFTYLYGGIPTEAENIEFFKKTNIFIKKLWYDWNTNGYIESPISTKKIYKIHHPDLNKQTLFNYLIQLYEMSNSIVVIEKVNDYLKNKDGCKVVLYTYDSLLFDMEVDNNFKENIINIKNILEQNDKFHVKYKYGTNYNDMVR